MKTIVSSSLSSQNLEGTSMCSRSCVWAASVAQHRAETASIVMAYSWLVTHFDLLIQYFLDITKHIYNFTARWKNYWHSNCDFIFFATILATA
jgi:hypothetical protein